MHACCKLGGTTSAFPDVCNVPTPTGNVPTPFPNLGQMSMALPGATNVLIAGTPAVTKRCIIPVTSGDEPGVAMGVSSGTIKGPVKFLMGSMKVRIEGSQAQRMGDPTTQNKDNAMVGAVIAPPSQVKVMILS